MDKSIFFDTHPIFVYDLATYEIYDANSSVSEVYGFPREYFIGRKITELGERKHLSDFMDTLEYTDELIGDLWLHERKDGTKFIVQFTTHMFRHLGNPAKLGVVHDVSSLIEEGIQDFKKYPGLSHYSSELPLAEIEWDGDFNVTKWSESAESLFGWTEEDATGKDRFHEELIHPDDREEAIQKLREVINQGKPNCIFGKRNIRKDGRRLHCEWYNTIIYNENGEAVSIQSLVHDITEREESEFLFRVLSEESLVGVYLIQDGIFKYVNPKFAEIFHYGSTDQIENKLGPLDLAHPDDRDLVEENIRKRIKGKRISIEYDFRCLTKDDKTIHVNVYGTRIEYRGEPAVIGTLVDITDRKLALERYKASVKSFEDLFDSISEAIYIQDREGKFVEVNEGAVEMYGYDKGEFIGRNPEFLAAPGKVDLEETFEQFEKALEGEVQTFDWWGQRKNGEVFPKEVILNPGTYFGEKVVIAIARDITERYEADERLRKSEELFRQLFQNAPVGITMMDKHQEIRFVNRSFEEIFGYQSWEIKGLDVDRLIVPEELKEEAQELSSKIFKGEATGIISKRERKDGSLVDVMIYGVPVIVDGTTIAIFGIYVDITDRKRAEEQIRKSLREKEVLLAEIHHRVKNNLAVITGLLELQAFNSDSESARRVLNESQMRINSIALIHEKLYQSEDLSEISFDVYINELIEIVEESLMVEDKNVNLTIDIDPIKMTINKAIPCGLILNELITNSYKHAFPDREAGDVQIILQKENDDITLKVSDNGVGLPGDIDFDNPTSLGMTLIRTLSKQIDGEYRFDSNGNGTDFTLEFQLED